MDAKFYVEQLTEYSDTDFAQRIAEGINKDYPSCATVGRKNGLTACFVDQTYYLDCLKYVKEHCRIKEELNV